MTEKQLREEYDYYKAELREIRNRLVTIRQTYEELESITNLIRGLQAS